ncbi:MAG TPA: rhomboid family intramembrane serine protease [Solirubrobacteraceae bacterium]|nr:rhomboid family intramembrane serine protease [Solirubrobacteraceae bacterium]
MTTTPVGMRCPECAKQRTKVRRMRDVRTRPRVTFALIAINVVVFLAEQGQFTLFGATIHGTVINESILDRFHISVEHEYWRLVSSGFIHENLLHIGFNMYLLYLLGLMLEPAIGSLRFAAIYFTSLLAGSFGVLLATAAPSLGASGAVFGLMGAAVVELRARRISVMESGIGGLIILNLILSFSIANISVGAHVAGLIGGALAALAIRGADERSHPALGLIACLLLSAGAVAGGIAVAGTTATGFA